MRRRMQQILATTAFLFLVGPALATEVVHFTNGTAMPIRSHTVENGMIHVDLGDDAVMAFPEYMVDKIEKAGSDVGFKPVSSAKSARPSNRMAKGQEREEAPRSKAGRLSGEEENPGLPARETSSAGVEVDEDTGVAVYRPFKGSGKANKSRLGAAGNQRVFNADPAGAGEGTIAGTRRVGNRNVIPTQTDRRRKTTDNGPIVGLESNPVLGGTTDSREGSGDSDSGSDD